MENFLFCFCFKSSFHALKNWIRELQRYGPSDILIAIAGNKCDKSDQREVSRLLPEEFHTVCFALDKVTTPRGVLRYISDRGGGGAKAFWGLKLVIWDFWGVRNFLVDSFFNNMPGV